MIAELLARSTHAKRWNGASASAPAQHSESRGDWVAGRTEFQIISGVHNQVPSVERCGASVVRGEARRFRHQNGSWSWTFSGFPLTSPGISLRIPPNRGPQERTQSQRARRRSTSSHGSHHIDPPSAIGRWRRKSKLEQTRQRRSPSRKCMRAQRSRHTQRLCRTASAMTNCHRWVPIASGHPPCPNEAPSGDTNEC